MRSQMAKKSASKAKQADQAPMSDNAPGSLLCSLGSHVSCRLTSRLWCIYSTGS